MRQVSKQSFYYLIYIPILIIIISARDVARIQDEDDNLAQKKKLTKQRARESLESQIDLSQREAEKELIKGRKVESYKNQVFFLYILSNTNSDSQIQIVMCQKNTTKTCSKGFEQKVATLRLKIPLKMKDSQAEPRSSVHAIYNSYVVMH